MKSILSFFFTLIFLGSLQAQNHSANYSFFTAGHTYGNPMSPQYGLHPPFVDYIPTINNYPGMELGFFTGDVVLKPTADYWDSAQIDIDKFNVPIHLAAGNHDIGSEFSGRFEGYYFDFVHQNDLFIILTPGLDHWNISGEQLDFLTRSLDSNYASVNHIFIFLHELIWWSPDNEYKNIKINYEPHYPGSTNYDTIVKPLLLSYPNQITVYAGDLGATSGVSSFMYHHFDNITLIGSGMGGEIRDNIIVTEVYGDSVYYNLVAINGDDPKALGELSDFILSQSDARVQNTDLLVYPNPCRTYFKVENRSQFDLKMSVYNIYGQRVYAKSIDKNAIVEIGTESFGSGMYILRFTGNGNFFERKIIIR